MQPKRLLVPLDGSPLAEFALDEVRDIAGLTDSRVTLLHVVPTIEDVIHDGGEVFTIDEVWERCTRLITLKSISQRPEWQKARAPQSNRPTWRKAVSHRSDRTTPVSGAEQRWISAPHP